MDRREFAKLAGLSTLLSDPRLLLGGTRPDSEWPEQVFRRYSVDMHVPDWSPELFSRFDASKFIGLIAEGGAQSMMMMANSHTGLCVWRTKIGRMHANLDGRDFFGEVVTECRRRKIHPVAYFSVIFDNASFESHPDWRIHRAEGDESMLKGRYGVCCPNSPYRDYVFRCTQELAANYDIDGLFCDMTFWPGICYCDHCALRFRNEHGSELPRTVDWDDPLWRSFQKARQEWLIDLVTQISAGVKKTRPITVSHQCSTIFHNWTLGSPLDLSTLADYPSGDFYGGATQHSLACKVYHGLARTRPFEFVTSRTRIFTDHVTVKPMPELRTECFVATLHSAALMLVDYINVDGTLNPEVYRFLQSLSAQRAAYEPFLGGNLLADGGIYYDKESMYNPEESKIDVAKLQAVDKCPHREAVVGAARILQRAHIPFGVFTNANLRQIEKYRFVIVPSVLEMTSDQAAVFRKYVENGGILIATGATSLDRFRSGGPAFHLEDVFGVRHIGSIGTKITYISPRHEDLRKAIWPQDFLSVGGPMLKGEALPGAEVLATVTLPFVAPELGHAIGSHFAAIHSNPPALEPGADPAIVMHAFGKGRSIWLASSIESNEEPVNSQLFLSLIRQNVPPGFCFDVETHPSVEMTLFHQPERKCMLAGFLNLEREIPQINVGASVRVKLPANTKTREILRLPDKTRMPFQEEAGYARFRLEPFEAIAMAQVLYDQAS
jgi:hypothetical protein